MRWSRWLENLVLGTITPLQVLACRLRPRRAPASGVAGDILVIRCEASIGDNLLDIPFLRALRAVSPEQKIHLLHDVAARDIYRDCPYIGEHIEIDWKMSSPLTLLRWVTLSAGVFARRPKSERHSRAVLPRWDEYLHAPFLAALSGAKCIVGSSRLVLPETRA